MYVVTFLPADRVASVPHVKPDALGDDKEFHRAGRIARLYVAEASVDPLVGRIGHPLDASLVVERPRWIYRTLTIGPWIVKSQDFRMRWREVHHAPFEHHAPVVEHHHRPAIEHAFELQVFLKHEQWAR